MAAVKKQSPTPSQHFPVTEEEKPAPSPTPTPSTASGDFTATLPQENGIPGPVSGTDSTIYVPAYSKTGVAASAQTVEENTKPTLTSDFNVAIATSTQLASAEVKSASSTVAVAPPGTPGVKSAVPGSSQITPTPTPLACVILTELGVSDPSCNQEQPIEVPTTSQVPVVVIASKTYTVSLTPGGQSTVAPYIVISSQTYIISSTSLGGGQATYNIIASNAYTISAIPTPAPAVKTQSKAGSATGTGTGTSAGPYNMPEVKSGASSSTSGPRNGGSMIHQIRSVIE